MTKDNWVVTFQAAFHQMMAPHGSFAEYAISEAHTTFHLPKVTSFEGRVDPFPLFMSNLILELHLHSCKV